MSTKRKPGGHPARADPTTDKTFRTMKAAVELVRDTDSRLSPEAHLNLRAAALGLMHAYAELAGLPAPTELLGGRT
ncbi:MULTISPECIES: hypothetical protein [Arthrobacter]|uniref:Uncharacterized protein n=1 Tax=Arthrobacter terricola TaxID=2547396 RepID=A0A4R5K5C9_9MICC|nr:MULTISPECIES: hypothetical protein [Arthrobacter]MBT8163055.1 hypothetical protein [Arthrobacter sp. GN70]TDF88095.1 hypothetical protein E1809_24050 [Arthrobacter terricola]